MQMITPLVDCTVDDALIKLPPLLDQALLQMCHIRYPRLVHLILQHSPDLVIDRIEIRAVWWPNGRCNESRRFTSQHLDCIIGVVSWCTVLLKDQEFA